MVSTFTGPSISPYGIALGPDGNLWFTNNEHTSIGRITPAGVISTFPGTSGSSVSFPRAITAGPDGNMWFTSGDATEDRSAIGRITPAGVIWTCPRLGGDQPHAIAAGPDGNLWFTERESVQRITPSGVITSFSTAGTGSALFGITSGPDGNMWFAGSDSDTIRYVGTGLIPAPIAPAFTASTPPTSGTLGTAYGTYTFVATGNPTPAFTVATGSLPTGLSLSGTSGVLSGTPTTIGSFTFTVRASNGISPDAVSSSITITVAPSIAGSRFTSVSPARVWDSRVGPGPMGRIGAAGIRR